MSTSAVLADLSPSWKQEVNRRVAAHQSRKRSSTAEARPRLEPNPGAHSRAAEAAARVAARYAKVPSYSEMLANEARAAVRAAEAVSRAALEAQAAAESILAGLEAATVTEHQWESAPGRHEATEQVLERPLEAVIEPARPAPDDSAHAEEKQSFAILWDADLPVRSTAPAAFQAIHGPGVSDSSVEEWWQSARLAPDGQDSPGGSEAIEVVEPAQPIRANVIQFPRELVAARKIRPRLAEGPHAQVGDSFGQLSIFEVDPESISTQPEAAATVVESAPAWPGPGWSSIRLEEQSLDELPAEESAAVPAPTAAALELASMGRRMMAAVVDCSLIAGAFLAVAMAAMEKARVMPNLHQAELGAAVTLVLLAALYHVFFVLLAATTPGMLWARISVSTFSGKRLTFDQRCGRLGALVMSLLPVGLGVAWAIFDDEHLCWHDRLSGSYVRRG